MEAEESPFLWVRLVSGGCSVGSAWEEFSIEKPLPLSIVHHAFEQFAAEIPEAAKLRLGIDISDLIR
jgi:hypothetical protein